WRRMETISTRRHLFKFYFMLIFFFVFSFWMGSLLIFTGMEIFNAGEFTRKQTLLPLVGLICYGLAFSMPFAYWKNSPKITVNRNSIRFGKHTFNLKDIENLELTSKVPFRYMVRFPMEGSSITFKDGTVKYIFDDMYANSWEIKSFLHRAVNNVAYIPQPITNFDRSLIESEQKEVFKGNPFISLTGILLWGGIGMFTFAFLNGNQSNSAGLLLAFLSVVLFWFFIHSWSMHYFSLMKDFLIIKNHNLLWRKRYVRLSDIEEVVIEIPEKQANTMRLITKDFKSRLYPAGTLRTQTWRDLIERLDEEGISVRNECIDLQK